MHELFYFTLEMSQTVLLKQNCIFAFSSGSTQMNKSKQVHDDAVFSLPIEVQFS